jgi:hypothetical protein
MVLLNSTTTLQSCDRQTPTRRQAMTQSRCKPCTTKSSESQRTGPTVTNMQVVTNTTVRQESERDRCTDVAAYVDDIDMRLGGLLHAKNTGR